MGIAGGTISGGIVATASGSSLVATSLGGTLDGVTLGGTLDLTSALGVNVSVVHDLALSGGSINIGVNAPGNAPYGYVRFSSTESLKGSGTVTMGGGGNSVLDTLLVVNGGNTLTIGSGITVQGGGAIGYNSNPNFTGGGSPSVIVVNQGTIDANISGAALSIDGSNWSNDSGGKLEVQSGGTLNLGQAGNSRSWSNLGTVTASSGTLSLGGGAWSNTGTITATNSTVNLGGSFSLSTLGSFSRSGGTVNLTGFLNNASTTLTLDATAGSWALAGGTISGGIVATSGGSALVATSLGGTLDGVTLGGTLDLTSALGVNVSVVHDLTLSGGSINIGVNAPGNAPYGYVRFSSTESLKGSGTVTMGGGGNSVLDTLLVVNGGDTLTIGSGITVQGAGAVGYNSNPAFTGGGSPSVVVINHGTIDADISGATLAVNGTNWQNAADGTVEAQSGGTLLVQGTLSGFSSGTLTGGTFEALANGTIRGFASGISASAANIVLSGAGSNFYTGTSGTTDALASLVTNSAGGTFTVGGGRMFTAASGFSNAGNLIVGSGSTFTETGTYTQSAATGVTEVDGNVTTTNSTVNITGGTVDGNGTISANLTNSADLAPGDSPGILTITGTYTQTASGTLDLQLGGTDAATPEFDELHVSGTVSLAGTLNVTLLNGFVPVPPQSFRVLTFGANRRLLDRKRA